MNFQPQFDRFPSQNPPPTHGLQSLYPPSQSHQPLPPPKPPINPHHFHLQTLKNPPLNPPINPPPSSSSTHSKSSDYSQQRLIDEVIYLHSLWHKGPPRPPIQTHHYNYNNIHYVPQFPNPNFNPLKPNIPTNPFKKKGKNKHKPKVVSDKEWPINPKPTSPSPTNGWGEFKAQTGPNSHPVPAEEQERVLSVRVHLKGLDSFISFFNHDDDDDHGVGDDDDEEYDEEEVFEFLWGVFEKDDKLREYYKTKFENGEFYCLVCGVIAKQQLGRKYKNCVALVQHSVTISRSKRKVAHRGFGRAVCKVLGWDIEQLPSIASSVSCCVNSNNVGVVAEGKDLEKKNSDSETPFAQHGCIHT